MQQLFKHSEHLQAMGLDIPRAVKVVNALRERGIELGDEIVTAEDLLKAIIAKYNQKHSTEIDENSGVFDMYDFSQKWLTSEEREKLGLIPKSDNKPHKESKSHKLNLKSVNKTKQQKIDFDKDKKKVKEDEE